MLAIVLAAAPLLLSPAAAQSVDELKAESDRAFRGSIGAGVLKREWGEDWPHAAREAISPRPAVPPVTTADPRADASARDLLRLLRKLYGFKTLAGQQGLDEIERIRSATGLEPAVGAFDLMDYSPSRVERGASPSTTVERMIEWSRRGGIVALCWHWNAPSHLLDQPNGKEWFKGFYSNATTFDLAAALAHPESADYRLIIRDLDSIALQLKKLQAAGVPVLWRPLHEGSGGWFWWGAKGSRPYIALWRLMFERFTSVHGLHNLLWVYSPPAGRGGSLDWYPGDSYVDVVGTDFYEKTGINGEWGALQASFSGRKLVALTESGVLPNPELALSAGMRWSWFALWDGDFLAKIPVQTLRAIYSDPDIVTLDRLPAYR
jgi:mannan endo-1,4-beta-mannosidase